MRFKLLGSLIACFLFLAECKNQISKVPVDEIFHINVDNTQDFIDLKLSNIVDSVRLIALETSKNVVIQANNFYVSEDFIIAFSQDGIYKFSSNGKFLKKILGWGRGPDEIIGIGFSYFCDESKNLLYIGDMNVRQKLLVYDLLLDKFLTPIKKSIPGNWESFSIYNDSLILGIPTYPFDSNSDSYALFSQNLNGKFLSGIPNFKKVLWGPNQLETFQRSYLITGNNYYRISFDYDDTLFTLKSNRLVPYLTLDFNIPRDNPPSSIIKNGDRSINFQKVEALGFTIIGVSIVKEVTRVSASTIKTNWGRKYFILNKITGKSQIVRTYEDDFSGIIQKANNGEIKFPMFLKNGNLVIIYQPDMIKKITEKGLKNPIFTQKLEEDLLKINRNLQETDNPILLIGKLKEKL